MLATLSFPCTDSTVQYSSSDRTLLMSTSKSQKKLVSKTQTTNKVTSYVKHHLQAIGFGKPQSLASFQSEASLDTQSDRSSLLISTCLQRSSKSKRRLLGMELGKTNGLAPDQSHRLSLESGTDHIKSVTKFVSHPPGVPRGCVAVYVGTERRRFVIPIMLLKHKLFGELLAKTEEEYGYQNEGGVRISCDPDLFEQFLHGKLKKTTLQIGGHSADAGVVCGMEGGFTALVL